jgi:hypothetical protein
MSRHSLSRGLQWALIVALFVGAATQDFEYGLLAFGVVFAGFGGWELFSRSD